MSVRNQVLSFLREPQGFSQEAADAAVWNEGLQFARAAIAAAGDYELRDAQVRAWDGLADARAGLVLGPPGTGKTHLLSWLILGYAHARQAAGLPCRILVSAFTLNAIGNLLDAVARRRADHWPGGVPIRFIGGAPANGLSADIDHRARLDGKNAQTVIEEITGEPCNITGGSIWSVYRLLDSRAGPAADGLTTELFDLVCIDEASQMVLGHGLMTLGALKPGGRIVVAGDDRQLPPVRASREVSLGDRQLGGSLYSFLSTAGAPEFALEETFRLNGPLAAYPERKFYPGAYHSAVATRTLDLKADWQDGLADWERTVLDPQWPICVLLHDGAPAATTNELEADLTVRLTQLLTDRLPHAKEPDGSLAADLWTEQLAIISPHRAQNALIRSRLPAALTANSFVETVDRIQGKERDAVLLSYCVADAEFALAEAEFIFAPERLNVAITRARTKLIVLVSRRLLDAVPPDQEVMDKAEMLREFVFSCTRAGEIAHRTKEGQDVPVQIRVLGFAPDQMLDAIRPEPLPTKPSDEEMTPALANILDAVRSTALGHTSGAATLSRLKQVLARGDDLLADLATLHRLGHLSLRHPTGPHGPFWVSKPLDPARHVFGVDPETVRLRLGEVITQTRRGTWPARYEDVRDRFAWPGPEGDDRLRPVLDALKGEGLVRFETSRAQLGIAWIDPEADAAPDERPQTPVPDLSDDDFEILNDLETLEARRINFGIFEAWTSAAALADETRRSRADVAGALGRLAADGWVMLAEESRIRSRMAELARELRYVKQRFAREDADERPYLVRSLKVELRDRDKPVRTTSLACTIERLAKAHAARPHLAAALRGLGGALGKVWGADAAIAGFQARGLEALTSAWAGDGAASFVVAADTGSGKTEAGGLPLIVGAAADRLAGLKGVKAVLAYPRVRLATNQAQRLTAYLAALAQEPGMPVVTLGLQLGQVPERFDALGDRDRQAGWTPAGDGQFNFPFFACPAAGCGAELILTHGGGSDGADRLACTHCAWRYSGWIGSKTALRATPPDLFLPTTDSLHQWLHDSRYGALFGDDPAFAPPRAILADEIHLYSHIHGAQVGLALRRLAARAELNRGDGRTVLAIGMSATLGDPAKAWGALIGRDAVQAITPLPEEKVRSPRGREYFYFVQPEVESRGQDIAGASTTIQSLMCLAHGMRRRTGQAGGFRSLVFLDSIDKVRRLHAAYSDAEESKRLAAYRTLRYHDDATGQPRDGCCGEPSGCDAFRNGECWWFGATDPRQHAARGPLRPGQPLRVADQPVFSGATGKIEALIKESDVVFSTSSLEVGYDDPDITLVYQHYAPMNLASFVQRKGRGGRGADDRPTTGVTLSIYSSRDSWWFRKPHEMIAPTGFEAPLNPDNHFVRRGQVLAAALDGFARHQSRSGETVNPSRPSAAALAAAEELVTAIFGPEPWRDFDDCPTLGALWAKAIGRATGPTPFLNKAREAIDWIPSLLFETINLPQLRVDTGVRHSPSDDGVRREDIALALSSAAPGNATRRFDQVNVLWRPPTEGRAPWFAAEDYKRGHRPKPFGDDSAELLARLPAHARPLLDGLTPELFRPRTLKLETLGRMHGIGWQPDWIVTDSATPTIQRDQAASQSQRGVQHDSRGSLRGFPIVKPYPEKARPLALPGLERWISRAEWFAGDSLGGRETGLAMARVYWAADAEVRLTGPKEDPEVFAQVFTDADGKRPLLHGYNVQTEGVCLTLDAAHLDAFVVRTIEALAKDEPRRRWHAGQMLRFLVESGAQGAGVNAYEARRGAELIVSAAGDPELRKRLIKLIRFWSADDLRALFEDTRASLLSQHPLLSARRVARLAGTLADPKFAQVFKAAVDKAGDLDAFRLYIKSVVVHSLAQRLKESFLQVGRGDERQVAMHVELPVQFNEDRPLVITLCEAGAFGDGTTRAFVKHIDQALAHWRDGFISQCPNAREDAAVADLFARPADHPLWRSLDPNDPAALAEVRDALGLGAEAALPASVLRILYGTETVGSDRFDLYDLAVSLRGRAQALSARLGREPSAWELTSAVVEAAEAEPLTPEGRLLAAYAGLEEASQEEALSPGARLADQVFRIQARLCVDGCQACVHQTSDLMSDGQVEATTSRRLLCEFVEG
ncbi:MAG: AAA family ATPase [Phenylobacterium sp.]|uniref:AAA domain-containing protein n=1 Tax=Phenylobacterium sp. TaxID=1871053 RepID=UPI0025FE1E4B|nr:AAA domain-containing protein [Phenylobacterium sp.]MCA3757233.1 AAA family ATPase [Phenylobacterium sp.]